MATAAVVPRCKRRPWRSYGLRGRGESGRTGSQAHHADDGGDGEGWGGSTASEAETKTARCRWRRRRRNFRFPTMESAPGCVTRRDGRGRRGEALCSPRFDRGGSRRRHRRREEGLGFRCVGVCAKESEREGDKGRRGGARRGGPPSPRDDNATAADERVGRDPGNGGGRYSDGDEDPGRFCWKPPGHFIFILNRSFSLFKIPVLYINSAVKYLFEGPNEIQKL